MSSKPLPPIERGAKRQPARGARQLDADRQGSARRVQPLPRTPITPSRRPNTQFTPRATMELRTFAFDANQEGALLEPEPATSQRQQHCLDLIYSGHVDAFFEMFSLTHRPATSAEPPIISEEEHALMNNVTDHLVALQNASNKGETDLASSERVQLSRLLLDKDMAQARHQAEEALHLAKSLLHRAAAHLQVATVAKAQNDLEHAADHFLSYFELIQAAEQPDILRDAADRATDALLSVCEMLRGVYETDTGDSAERVAEDAYDGRSATPALPPMRTPLQIATKALAVAEHGSEIILARALLALIARFVELGKHEDAQKGLERLLGLEQIADELKTEAKVQLGSNLLAQHEYERAVEVLLPLAQSFIADQQTVNRQFVDSACMVGQAYASLGQGESASQWYSSAANAARSMGLLRLSDEIRVKAGFQMASFQLDAFLGAAVQAGSSEIAKSSSDNQKQAMAQLLQFQLGNIDMITAS